MSRHTVAHDCNALARECIEQPAIRFGVGVRARARVGSRLASPNPDPDPDPIPNPSPNPNPNPNQPAAPQWQRIAVRQDLGCHGKGGTSGTSGTPEAGTRTAYIHCVMPRVQAALRLWYVQRGVVSKGEDRKWEQAGSQPLALRFAGGGVLAVHAEKLATGIEWLEGALGDSGFTHQNARPAPRRVGVEFALVATNGAVRGRPRAGTGRAGPRAARHAQV